MSKKHSRAKSFDYALQGLKAALNDEPNFKIHLIISILALLLGLYLKFSTTEWAILTLTIALVLVLELINTSIESFLDVVSPEKRPQVKKAKDTVAAAVLVSALASLVIGGLLFLPKLI